MIVNCPHCDKQLKLSEKVRESILGLEPGRKLKVKCVHCSEPFGLDAENTQGVVPVNGPSQGGNRGVKPPAPPSVNWLKDGNFEDQEVVEDIPRAMVLMPDTANREIIVSAAADFGYLVEEAATADEAIEKMQFVNFAAVFLHNEFEQGGIQIGKFHQYMREMDMGRRRYIFYVLLGDQYDTLYDLQALACSANIVVNDKESQYIGTVLRKAIPEYEALFGPLMEELRVSGQ